MVSRRRIDHLTARITEYRLWRHIRRAEQIRVLEDYVALELKGLKAKAMTARGHVSRLDRAYDRFNEVAPAHADDVEGLADQIGYMADDLSFATAALGNSVAASNASTEAVQPPQPPPVTFTLDPAKVVEQPPAAPAAVILNGSPGMRGDVQLIRS